MLPMQQRLAVASILVLVVMAGASAVLIAHNAYGQNSPKASTQTQSSHNAPIGNSATTASGSTTNSTGGSLLTTGNQNMTGSDDGGETGHETETETGTGAAINSTVDE